MLLFENPSPVVLSATAGVGVWVCPISVSAMCMTAPFWKLKNRAPNSDSIALDKTLRIFAHSTCIDTFMGGCFCGGFLGSADAEIKYWYPPALLLAPGYDRNNGYLCMFRTMLMAWNIVTTHGWVCA